jgi:VCBS repeat-containing protein
LSGGSGVDAAVFSGSFSDYRISAALLGFTVADQRTGSADGIDFVSLDIDTLSFADRVVVLSTNNAPLALNDDLGLVENAAPAVANVLANDFDFETLIGSQQLVVSAVNGNQAHVGVPIVLSSGALVSIGSDGRVLYNQNGAFDSLPAGGIATDIVSYTISDGAGGFASASLTIRILGSNDAAVITGISNTLLTEDAAATLDAFGTLTVTDPDAGEAVFMPKTVQAAHGTFTLLANGAWSYAASNDQPAIQALGEGDTLTDSFTAVSVDGSASRLVSVIIAGSNDAALITGTSSALLSEDAAATLTASGTLTVTDPDTGEAAFMPQTVQAAHGTFTLLANGAWSYAASNDQPAIQALGEGDTLIDSFTAVSVDGSASRPVSVTIAGVGRDPTAVNSIIHISADAIPANISWAVSGGDPEGHLSGFTLSSPPEHASVSLAADGTYSFDVASGFVGSDSFGFAAIDTDGQTGSATVSVGVYAAGMALGAGGAGNDVFMAGAAADIIQGNAGDDLIRGGAGDDFLQGDSGNDSLFGDAGYDYLFGGSGNDYLDLGDDGGSGFGDAGDDTLLGSSAADYLNAGSGNDTIYAQGGDDTVILFGGEVGDMANGGDGSDTLYFYADSAPVTLTVEGDALIANGNLVAQDFEDFWLYGTSHTDSIFGGSGADDIYGGGGNDTLVGGASDDRLHGDAGMDLLTGGSGSDQFILRPGDGRDQITDFLAGAGTEDVIDLLAFDSTAARAAVANATQVGSDTVIDLGGDQTLTLLGISVANLHADDFLFA